MMSKVNRFGLSRNIKPAIKYLIRKTYGFGCVICGNGIVEYEHVDPEFADASEHDPSCMTLLCPSHNQQKKRKFLSAETIKSSMMSPKALKQGFSTETLDVGKVFPTIIFAGNTFKTIKIPVRLSGVPILEINAPEESGAPFRISGNFYDSHGKASLRIVSNEWNARSDNWDFEAVQAKLIVRESAKEESLILRMVGPTTFAIDKIKCKIGNTAIIGDLHQLSLFRNDVKVLTMERGTASMGLIGYDLN